MDENYKEQDLSKVVKQLMDEEGYEFGEAVKEAMAQGYKDGGLMVAIQKFNQGGMAGDKTYHQFHDQYVPMDSESMGYAYGGGVGSMMKPRMNFAGGGGDFIPLGYDEDESITVEDLTVPSRIGDFRVSASKPLDDQSGLISAATNIMSPGVNTIEGSLIDGDDPSSRYAVQQDFPSTIDRFSNSTGPVPNVEATYEDMIMNPEGFPNALQTLERFQDNRFSDLDFQPGYDTIDDPNKTKTIKELIQNRAYNNNPAVGFFDEMRSMGNPDASLVNKTKNAIGSGIGSIMDFMGKIPTPFNAIKGFANSRNALNPDSQNYNPALQSQVDFLNEQGMYGKNANSGLAQITGGRLAGKNLQSLFGSNDLQSMYDKDLASLEKNLEKLDTRFSKLKKSNLPAFLAKQQTLLDKISQNKFEAKAAADAAAAASRKESAREYNTNIHGPNNYGLGADGKQSYDSGQGFGINATTGGPVSNKTGKGRTDYKDGGIVSLRR